MRSTALLAFSSCTIVFTAVSCSKTDDAKPAVATTGISGTFNPANGLATVTATPTTGTASTATLSSGAYAFNTLTAGSSTVTYAPTSGFEAQLPKR